MSPHPAFFSLWVVVTHFLNIFMLLLARSGLEVLFEFTDDVSDIGMGQGRWREDQQHYANAAGI